MAKLPYMKFYVADWVGATCALTQENKGRYIDLLAHIWGNSQDGQMRFLWEDLAALWQCTVTEASRIVTSLQFNNCICAKEFELENGLKGVEILQRRIHRDKKAYDRQAKRQSKYRKKVTLRATPPLRLSDAKVTPEKSEVRSQNITTLSSLPKNDLPQPDKPLTDIQRIVLAYKLVSGYAKDDKDWDKLNFARCTGSAKKLKAFLGSWELAADCIQEIYERFTKSGLTVTIETVVKHAAEWKKDLAERSGTWNGGSHELYK